MEELNISYRKVEKDIRRFEKNYVDVKDWVTGRREAAGLGPTRAVVPAIPDAALAGLVGTGNAASSKLERAMKKLNTSRAIRQVKPGGAPRVKQRTNNTGNTNNKAQSDNN